MAAEIPTQLEQQILQYQRNEITEHRIYRRLAQRVPSEQNCRVLESIAADELRHYDEWKRYTHQEVAPDPWQVLKYTWSSRIFGFTSGVRPMERGEANA